MKKNFFAIVALLTVCINITGCFDSDYEEKSSQYDKVITAEAVSETYFDTFEITTITVSETTNKEYFTSVDITEATTSTAATIFTPEITTLANIITTPTETSVTTSTFVATTTTVTTITTTPTTITITTTTPVPDALYTNVVYIAASGKGKKYHNNPKCSNMKGNVASISIEIATARGYTPCKKCYG